MLIGWIYPDLGCHVLLADEMGLGKTLQVLSLLHAKPVKNKPALVVCPASVVPGRVRWRGFSLPRLFRS